MLTIPFCVDGVGKSSIITSLIKEAFVTNVRSPAFPQCLHKTDLLQVPHVVPEVTIPPEITPENFTTSIVDTSCMLLSIELLETQQLIGEPS